MSISPEMKAVARSVYRTLYRASNSTFAGDSHVLQAFRMKMRNDAIAARAIIDPETYEQQTQFGRENVVQGVKVPNAQNTAEGKDTFRLRLTKDTELGSNDSIKDPPPIERSNRSMRKREKASVGAPHLTSSSVTDVAPHNDSFASFSSSHLSMNYSQLKKVHKQRVLPDLKEEDLEESFVRGSGPVGHHAHTSTYLDRIANPGLSKQDVLRAKQRERERRRRKKAKKKTLEKAGKEDEELPLEDVEPEGGYIEQSATPA
ncbi:hypothetical protein FPV67DRAFT_1509434 [Lyophyllum atratum]|nr:hypothetical protein FPV67DRAFT_1509434 [Lyophyllum atratum]